MDLDGKWINEFGSIMELTVDKKGFIKGTYYSHTGATGTYNLAGITDVEPESHSRTFAFSISWRPLDEQPSHPSFHWCSGFTGQLQKKDGEETLTTTFMLIKDTAPDRNWESTIVDKAVFHRLK